MARYLENGNAKVATCKCSASAVHEKSDMGWQHDWAASWKCRNCGAHSKRIVRDSADLKELGGLFTTNFGA